MEDLTYDSSFLAFPIGAPIGNPHIISSEFEAATDTTDLRAADGVATLLYRWDLDALCDFLDLEYDYFEFTRLEKDNTTQSLIIIRRGREVTCGAFNFVGPSRNQEWDMKLRYHINDDGAWKPTYGHLLRVGRAENRDEVEDWGAQFAQEVLLGKKWEEPKFGQGVEMSWRVD